MIQTIIPRSTDERETERNGVLSTLDEFHALIIGLVVGGVVILSGSWELAALFVAGVLGTKLSKVPLETVRKERWYALGGFAIGAIAVGYGPALLEVLVNLLTDS